MIIAVFNEIRKAAVQVTIKFIQNSITHNTHKHFDCLNLHTCKSNNDISIFHLFVLIQYQQFRYPIFCQNYE